MIMGNCMMSNKRYRIAPEVMRPMAPDTSTIISAVAQDNNAYTPHRLPRFGKPEE